MYFIKTDAFSSHVVKTLNANLIVEVTFPTSQLMGHFIYFLLVWKFQVTSFSQKQHICEIYYPVTTEKLWDVALKIMIMKCGTSKLVLRVWEINNNSVFNIGFTMQWITLITLNIEQMALNQPVLCKWSKLTNK